MPVSSVGWSEVRGPTLLGEAAALGFASSRSAALAGANSFARQAGGLQLRTPSWPDTSLSPNPSPRGRGELKLMGRDTVSEFIRE
ncbi:hypothetical protein D9M68_291260 [compost metagenome]